MSLPGEFELIRRYFAPLAGEGSLALTDDAAVREVAPGCALVATADALVAGVHFLPNDPPELIARKALRVNLSDLAAMGAEPIGYLLVLALPVGTPEEWVADFAGGLSADQAEFGIHLLGGDTSATPGPLTLAITALGQVPTGGALLRSGARPGDGVYVSGTIGDGALGLQVARGAGAILAEPERAHLLDRYRLPRPRLALGKALRGIAGAAMDVSDGLAADLSHLAAASGVAATIEAARVPLSPAARALIEAGEARLADALTGGDDYELLFTVPPERQPQAAALAGTLGLPLSRIGQVEEGAGIRVLDAKGRRLSLGQGGWRHF